MKTLESVDYKGTNYPSRQRIGTHRPFGYTEPPPLSADHISQFSRLVGEWLRSAYSLSVTVSPTARLGLRAPLSIDDTSSVASVDQPPRMLQSDPNLDEALMDLHSVRRKARAAQEVIPSEALVRRAGRILRTMHKMDPRRYLVYGMQEGDVVIDADTKRGTKLSVICSDDGPTRCMFYRDGKLRKKPYDDDTKIEDDEFIKNGLMNSPRPE